MRILITILLCHLLAGCAAFDCGSSGADRPAWNGKVESYGALHAIHHEGQTGEMVTLDTMLPDPHLYALGALTGLSGEVTVIGGTAYLSYPEGMESSRTEMTSQSRAGATLLVAAEVEAWRSVTTADPIPFEKLDEEIARLAVSAGLGPDARFPFLMEGEFVDLQWHVIDGTRLTGNETSCADHLKASVRARRDRVSATLVGFYSNRDQGVFTRRGSRTHIHCLLDEPVDAGHVDHVDIPAGTVIKFPRGRD